MNLKKIVNVTHESSFFPHFYGKESSLISYKMYLQTSNVDAEIPQDRERNSTAPVKILKETILSFLSYDVHRV